MEDLKYKVIKTRKQYHQYCQRHEELAFGGDHTKAVRDEMELLEVLIEKWDNDHSILREDVDPIAMLKFIMEEHQMQAKDLAILLDVSKGLVSEILNYKKGLSKENIRILAERFKVRQEAFNRQYELQKAPVAQVAIVAKTITRATPGVFAKG